MKNKIDLVKINKKVSRENNKLPSNKTFTEKKKKEKDRTKDWHKEEENN